MSLFLILLLVALYYFVVRPAWRLYKLTRDPQKAMEDFLRRNGFGAPAADDDEARAKRGNGRKAGWSAPVPRKKKIDPNAGDYVRFTNLPADAPSATTESETTIEIESQTIDVTWEELPK